MSLDSFIAEAEASVPNAEVLQKATHRLVKRYHHRRRLVRHIRANLECKDYNDSLSVDNELYDMCAGIREQAQTLYDRFPDDELLIVFEDPLKKGLHQCRTI